MKNMNIKKTVTGIIIFLSFSCSQRDAEYYYLKGYKCYKKQNYELAIECFNKAIDIDSKDADVYFARALSYDWLGEKDLAIADYTSAIKYNYKGTGAYYNRGVIYLVVLNKYDKAISDFEMTIKLDSMFLKPYFKLVEIYGEQYKLDLFAEYLNKIISIDPLNAEAYFLRGTNFANQKRYQQAIEDFDMAIKLEPHNDNFYFARGGIYAVLDNIELALQDFNKGIEVNPKNSTLFFVRAGLYRKFLKDNEKAIEDYKKAADLGYNDAKTALKDYYNIDYQPTSK